MSNNKLSISYCFGSFNEEEVIFDTVKKLIEKLTIICGKKNFEILVVDNGSTDKTPDILKKFKSKNVTSIFIKEKNHGVALKTAIKEAKYNYVVLTGADLPFGFSDIEKAVKIWSQYDIIFGSKAHPKSVYATSFNRKIASKIYSFLLRTFFKLNIKDSQGSIFLKRDKVFPLLKYCTAKNAFFTSQLAIYAQRKGLKIFEIPVKSKKNMSKRESKYKITKDGPRMFRSVIQEYMKAKKI